MSVKWENIQLPFGMGQDDSVSDHVLKPPTLETLENAIFEKTGTITKRKGFDQLTRDVRASGTDISAAKSLFTREDELLLADGGKLYSYSPDQLAWLDKGSFVPFDVTHRNVYGHRGDYSQAITYSGLRFLASVDYGDSLAPVLSITVTDATTGAIIKDRTVIPVSTNELGRVYLFEINGFIHLVWAEYENPGPGDFNIRGLVIDLADDLDTELAATPNSILAATGATSGTSQWAATSGGSGASAALYISYYDDGGPTARVTKRTQNSQTSVWSEVITGLDAAHDIAVAPNGKIFVVSGDGTVLKGWVLNTDGTTQYGPTNIDASTIAATQPSICVDPTASAGVYRCDIFAGYGTGVQGVYKSAYYTDDSVTAESLFKAGMRVASEPFVVGTSMYIILYSTGSPETSAYVFRSDGLLVGRALYALFGASSPTETVHAQVYVSGTTASTVLGHRSTLGVTYFVRPELMDFEFASTLTTTEVAGVTFLSGNILQQYDGLSVVESGFLEYPSNFTLASTSTGSGLTNGATYGYKVFYCWRNNKGQIERSSFTTKSVTLSTAAHDNVTLTIPYLTATNKTGVFIEIYRTLANGSTYYLINSTEDVYPNSTSAYVLTTNDGQSDSTIETNAILEPFPDGTLDPIPPQSARVLARGKRRVFTADLLSTDTVYYSKYRGDGEGVSFNDALVVSIPDEGGRITGIGVMDSVVAVFKESRIYAFTGDGADNTGQGTFSEPDLLTTDTGCSDQRTIQLTPQGLVFMSPKGIYLLNRAMQLQYIGGPVEDNDANVVDVALIEDEPQVRFLSSSGKTLVYAYDIGQWSTFTGVTGVASCIWRGAHTYVSSTGIVRTENPTSYQDNATDYSMLIETAWISLEGLQGFQRIRKAMLLGNYHSAHSLAISVGYDYATSYGRTETYTYSSGRYQAKVNMSPQKCQAIRFKFVDTPSGTRGKCVELSSLELEVGTKQGLYRQAASRTVG